MSETKICRTCKQNFNIDDFYKAETMKDGHVKDCKWCSRKNALKYSQTDEHRERMRQYRKTHKEQIKGYKKTHRNSSKNSLWEKTRYAIYTQKIPRPDSCLLCGCDCIPEAHHSDYDKPYHIAWCCRQCHTSVHKFLREKKI